MVNVSTAPSAKRVFAGRAWKNTSKTGKAYINGSFDKGVIIDGIDFSGVKFQLWDNAKREGKKDADLRLSILVA